MLHVASRKGLLSFGETPDGLELQNTLDCLKALEASAVSRPFLVLPPWFTLSRLL